MENRIRLSIFLVMLITALPCEIHSQSIQDPANANADNTVYYFDSNSDCNNPAIRELYGFQATIRGNDLTSTRLGPKSCSIRLRSTGQFDGTVLDIEVKAMNILDCSTSVTIYDGDGPQRLLMSFDCHSNQNLNRRKFSTTGNTATFIMTRENVNVFNFDIEIRITPIRGGTEPGYENSFGSGYFFDKFPQTTIVGMIGGFYGLILVICIVIVVQFFCTYSKQDKKWEIQQLATIKSGATFDIKSQPSNVWSVEMKQSRGPGSQHSLTLKDIRTRKTLESSIDGDSSVVYNDDALQKKRLMNTQQSRSRYVSSNASFTEPEEDSDNFVEKIITPRVKSSNSKSRQPPPYEDAVSDHTSVHSSDEESEVTSSSSHSVTKLPVSSEEGSENSRSSYTQSETVSESEDDRSSRNRGARAQRHKEKPQKGKRQNLDENNGGRRKPAISHQQMSQPPSQTEMQHAPYGAYQSGQYLPVMVGPNQLQPVAFIPPLPPRGYPQYQETAQPKAQVHLTDPPVYSYLVRRGYTPLDARNNSVSTIDGSQISGVGQLEQPELRLGSGVEYMRR